MPDQANVAGELQAWDAKREVAALCLWWGERAIGGGCQVVGAVAERGAHGVLVRDAGIAVVAVVAVVLVVASGEEGREALAGGRCEPASPGIGLLLHFRVGSEVLRLPLDVAVHAVVLLVLGLAEEASPDVVHGCVVSVKVGKDDLTGGQ